jgi:hypothetical protein
VKLWFIVAVMLGVYSDGTQDVYIFEQPKQGNLYSAGECKSFVRDNPLPIMRAIADEFSGRPIQKVICVSEENVKRFMEERNLDVL